MAKKQQQKGNGKGHQQKGSGGGRAGSVAENIKNTEGGRSIKRNENKLRDRHQMEERERGVFHARVNEGRSNDLVAAIIRGEPGSYAWPGGNEPSLHFSVSKEIRRHDTVQVVRFEAAQKGHELEGYVFDPKVWLPCKDILRHGTNFQSRAEDRLMAATQELIAHYLAEKLEEAFVPETHENETFDVWAHASESCMSMLSEKNGFYVVRSNLGDVVFKVYHLGKKACIKVAASKNPALDVTGIFVPVHCLFEPSLNQVTDDATYLAQLAIFMFIRTELAELIEKMTKKPTPTEATVEKKNLTDADREALAKAEERRQRKAKNKFAKQREEQARQMAIAVMKQNCLPAVQIATGKLGYIDLGSSSGELIVGFHISGADRIARIEHMGDNHMLKLAGIEKGDNVFVGAIRTGEVDRANCTTETDFRKRSIIADHIRGQMEARGIRFLTKQAA